MSEDGEFLGVAGFNLDDLLDVDGVLGGGLRDEEGSFVALDGGDLDDVASVGGVTDGRLTAVHEGLRLTGGRVLGVLDDLADNVVAA